MLFFQDIATVNRTGIVSEAYQSNFGDYDPSRARTVEANLKAINTKLNDTDWTFRSVLRDSPEYAISSTGKDTVAAWVRASQPNQINLQRAFWSLDPVDQAGTIIHEVSHLAAGTLDYGYGALTLQTWAQGVPMSAIRNAENYALYTTSVP